MRATTVMLVAIAGAVLGRWAHNKPTATAKDVVEGLFAVLVIGLLDSGATQPIAQGFAWLFLVVVLLGANSPITALANVK